MQVMKEYDLCVQTCAMAHSATNKLKTGLAGQMGMIEVGRSIPVDCLVEVVPEASTHLLFSLSHDYLPGLPQLEAVTQQSQVNPAQRT